MTVAQIEPNVAGNRERSAQASDLGVTRLAPSGSARTRRRLIGYTVATVGIAALTAILLQYRDDLTPLSVGFGYLVVVVVAAAIGRLGPGLLASVLGFLTFNYFFLPPYDTFIIERAEYVVVLFVFLALSILISTLLARVADRAEAAEAREMELSILQSLSAQLTAVLPGPDTYTSILSSVVQTFGFAAGALFVQAHDVRELREEAVVGAAPGAIPLRGEPGTTRTEERLPLSVGGRNLGLLVLRIDREPLSPAESRVLRAFCDQFALVLERDRLLRAATETEVLRKTDRTRRALLDAVSHDLRSPLAAIKASVTDLLGSDAEHDPTETKEALESIDAEADRLTGLIANLLDMSRIEQGTIVPRVHVVDVGEAINAAVDRMRQIGPNLRFSVRLTEDPSLVRADPVFLDRVVANLLDNAMKAAAESDEKTIDVDVRAREGRTTIRLVDHGPGVPPDAREQLFFPFYQLSDRHPRHGTGLGLAICRGFLSLMDGEIWIEDTPGGGATFAFSLPTAETGT